MDRMYKDMIIDAFRYAFDGALLTIVWAWNNLTILNIDHIWTKSFGEYAETAKIFLQVLITVIVVVTAFYRMRREILKYRKEKKDSAK